MVKIIKRRWTKDEIIILKSCYGILSAKEIAEMLNRSIYSIYNKAFELGLRSGYPRGRLPKIIKKINQK